MDIAKKQQRRKKAQDFIKTGSTKRENIVSPAEAIKIKPKKKHVAYYLDVDLIRDIKIQAAKNGEEPCHLIERAARQELG